MKKTFEERTLENLRLDIDDAKAESKNNIDEAIAELKILVEEDVRIAAELSEKKIQLKEHLLNKNNIQKEFKKEWKITKKRISIELKGIKKNKKNIENDILLKNNLISNLKINLERTIEILTQVANNEIEMSYQEDMAIINSLIISPLATKIKVELKLYETQIVSRNPRVGMSLGTNFKPRVFISGSATRKEKRVLSSHEKFDIRKKDNFEIRVEEIAEMLNIENYHLLENHIILKMKQAQGSQYLNEFLNN